MNIVTNEHGNEELFLAIVRLMEQCLCAFPDISQGLKQLVIIQLSGPEFESIMKLGYDKQKLKE